MLAGPELDPSYDGWRSRGAEAGDAVGETLLDVAVLVAVRDRFRKLSYERKTCRASGVWFFSTRTHVVILHPW